jgi:peptidoglycan hydrolase-like protein with peptidoglycan-binding domain
MWSILIGILPSLIQLVPSIISAWDTSTNSGTSGVAAVAAVVTNSTIDTELATLGATMFPKLSPELQAAAAALSVAHPNNTSWIQSAINLIASTGFITLSTPLVVDGVVGPLTIAAVEAIQAKAGYPVTGFVADVEYNFLSGMLAKINGIAV